MNSINPNSIVLMKLELIKKLKPPVLVNKAVSLAFNIDVTSL